MKYQLKKYTHIFLPIELGKPNKLETKQGDVMKVKPIKKKNIPRWARDEILCLVCSDVKKIKKIVSFITLFLRKQEILRSRCVMMRIMVRSRVIKATQVI